MNFNSKKPIFETIRDYYANLIEKGALAEGTEMPSVREVAINNGVNPNTVQRAFSMLVEDGYLVSVPKKGFFVNIVNKDNEKSYLEQEIRKLLEEGYSINDIKDVLEGIEGNDRNQ